MTTFINDYNALLDQGQTIEELSHWTTTFHTNNNRLLFSCDHVSKELGGGVIINSKNERWLVFRGDSPLISADNH